jgi:hypothetical protein
VLFAFCLSNFLCSQNGDQAIEILKPNLAIQDIQIWLSKHP